MKRVWLAPLLFATPLTPLYALPTMIRLGYPNCASCHISPQGGGLLNPYGRGIDEAQSLRAGEYKPSDSPLSRSLSWGGRITQDLRAISQEQLSASTGKPIAGVLRNRVMYRNATELGRGFRFSAIVNAEHRSAPRPERPYDPAIRSHDLFVSHAMFAYRPKATLEFALGRDQLPSGVNNPDLNLFVRSRNRLGYYDSPTQVKAFWWGKRWHLNPYAFAPSGIERRGEAESGGGLLAEADILGRGRTVGGINVVRGTARFGKRTMVGPYVRLGFGRWGFLAEHDMSERTAARAGGAHFRQNASYGQLFWAAQEWLVAYASGERLRVQHPFPEHLLAARLDLVARLSSNVTVGIGARVQRDRVTGQLSRAVVGQLALKTVN